MSWFVYILECKNKSLYTGITNDLKRRLAKHQSGQGAKFTRSFKVVRMVYSERKRTKSNALKREAEIKSWPRDKKLVLIQSGLKKK